MNNTKKLMWLITKHLERLQQEEYFGSEQYVEEQAEIYDLSLAYGFVKQSWYDNRLKATETELMCELLYVIGANYMYKEVEEIMHSNHKDLTSINYEVNSI